ncbi:hypothetical protein HPB49_018693 [Dermacentor silvarum]|uniref:Uncharacterized protein n=1 Tax=Dermacentor silvarum TaxID=543639 RepID=A0ACB8CSH1_DERSI|nr:hypothetical protein HPB49_018693 [Dermacentor silvarum]
MAIMKDDRAVMVDQLKATVERLESQRRKTKAQLQQTQDCLDSARMVKRLKHMLDKADSGDGAAPVAVVSAPKVGRSMPKPSLSSGPRVPVMKQLSTKHCFVRRAITKAISTIDALLSDEVTPQRVLHRHLELILAKQAELVEFDRAIQETLMDAYLEADLSTAFKYEQKVSFTKRSVRHATKPRPPILAGPTAQLASPPYPATPSATPGVSPAASSASQRHHPRELAPLGLNPPSTAALSTEVRSPYTRPCLLCNASDNTTQECSKSCTSGEERRKLQARRRCFRCAKCNHVASECRSARNFQCAHCAGQQFTSLCNVCTQTQNQAKRLGNASPSVQRASGPESVDTPPRATSVSASGTVVMPATTFWEGEISILIRSDLYWDVVTGQISGLSPQVTAVVTRFGWVVQGTLHDFSQDSTVGNTSLVFGSGEPSRDDAPTKSPKAKKSPTPTRLSKRNRRGSSTFRIVPRTQDGNSTKSTNMTVRNYV